MSPIRSAKMEEAIELWKAMEQGKPPWLSEDVRTIAFSNTIARELARLVVQEIDIKFQGDYSESDRPDSIQNIIDKYFLKDSAAHIEKMIRLGGVMAKWNGEGIELLEPGRFLVTDFSSDKTINGAVFYDYKTIGKNYYTRAEWHRWDDGQDEEGGRRYLISNKVFRSDNPDEIGQEISIVNSPWNTIEPEVAINGLTAPLFAYFKNPTSNTIDPESPLGVSLFAECREELRWLDVAMSNLGIETEDSKPLLFVDDQAFQFAQNVGIELPRFVKGLSMGISQNTTIDEWQPKLQIADRKEGINFYLSILSYKCGFDPGYFVFNGQTISVATATQVEATERRTVNTVQGYRNILAQPDETGESRIGFVHDLAYIVDVMQTISASENDRANFGNYKVYAAFADISVNPEEEKAFDYQLAQNGYMAKWRYLVRHLGMTEAEAKQYVQEAMEEQRSMNKETGLFDEE